MTSNLSVDDLRTATRNLYARDWRKPIQKGKVKIKTKDMRLIPLVPNEVQTRLMAHIWDMEQQGKPVRLMIPKARQHGISTLTEAIIYCKTAFTPNINAIIVADKSEHAANIFEMSKLIHDKMNPVIRTETHRRNAFEIAFSENQSKIEIGTTGRSGTYHLFHSSETAYYTDAENVMLGVLQTVPNLPGTMVIMESTGNGIGNYFYNRCMDAQAGRGDYQLFFIPWFENPEYSLPLDKPLVPQFNGEFGDECYYRDEYHLTLEQLNWRRYAITSLCGGDIHKFMQEYPATLDECFQGSGYPVFDQQILSAMEKNAVPPLATGLIEGNEIVLSEDDRGWLKVWQYPCEEEWHHRYCISADTGGTWEGADYDSAYVRDRVTGETVAAIHGHFDAYEYVEYLYVLSQWYHNAMIAIEINVAESETDEFGNTVVDLMLRQHPDANVYRRKVIDDQSKRETTRVGFHTNRSTKQSIVDHLRQFVNEWPLKQQQFNDRGLIDEMKTYIVTQTKTGKTSWNAVEGKKDDRVMSFGIGLVVAETMPMPYLKKEQPKTQTTEDALEAIL